MKLFKNINDISGHTKSTDLIIDIMKRIKISGATVPLRVEIQILPVNNLDIRVWAFITIIRVRGSIIDLVQFCYSFSNLK
jgi:hypothetical protein